MPISSFLPRPSLTRASPASNAGQDTQASNIEMRLRPSAPHPGSEQFASLPRQGFTNGSPPDFAPPNQHLQSPIASAEESSSIPLGLKRALELQKKSGPLEKTRNADEAKPIADVLVAELSPPVATFEECQELIEQLWDLNKLQGTDEIKRLDDGPYLQLVNAIMRYQGANRLEETQPASVVRPDQGVVNRALGQAMTAQLDRSAGIGRPRASWESRHMAQESVAEALRDGTGVDQAVATAAARYSLTHPADLHELRQLAVHIRSPRGIRVDLETREAARISVTADMGNGARVEQAVADARGLYGLNHPVDLYDLHRLAAGLESSRGPRAHVVDRDLAQYSMTNAMRNGVSREDAVTTAVARYGLTHVDDLNELRRIAGRLASNGGPRAAVMTRYSGLFPISNAMSNGASVEDAIAMAVAQNGLTHESDLHELRRPETTREPLANAVIQDSGRPRTTNAMRNGTTIQDPFALTGLPDRLTADDLNDDWLPRAAALTASGLRASYGTWMTAQQTIHEAIRDGASADEAAAEVIELYGMAHPDDLNAIHLNAIRQHAAQSERDRH